MKTMPVYPYTRSHKTKAGTKTITETYYYYQGKYTDPITGARVQYKKRGFKKESEAKAAERKLLLSVSKKMKKITVDELFQLYYDDRKDRIKQRSLSDFSYTYHKMLQPYWGTVKLSDITQAKVKEWQKHLLSLTYSATEGDKKIERRYSNEYMKTAQTLLKTLFNHAVILGYELPSSVIMFRLAVNKQERKKEMQFWHPEEFSAFIEVVDDPQDAALFNILYWCGLRIGEVLALRWADINFHTQMIRVNKTYDQKNRIFTAPKTQNSYRSVMMPRKCLEAVQRWHDVVNYYGEDKEQHIIFGVLQPMDDNTIRRHKEKYCKIAGVKNIRIHDFRHSHVSLLINQGFSAFDIAKRLGHTVEMVNNRYGHWFNDSQRKMIEKLDQI